MRPPAADHESLRAALRAIVGDTGLIVGDEARAYECGARYGEGRSACVVRPANVDEVSAVVRCCVAHGVAVVPQGANTGLVGASTPDASGAQVVLSLARLRQPCEIDVANRCATVGAGVLLQELNERLAEQGLWFPVDLSANPSIGGMVAANTGGTRLIRYGDVRHNLLAAEVVLFDPPGQVVQLGRALRKDNTGHDLKQLFVGTCGAGGIVTRATLEVHPRPKQSATALIVPTCDDAVMGLLTAIETDLGDFLSAFEGLSGDAMRAAIAHVPNLRNPFEPEPVPDFAVLVELESASSPSLCGLDLQDSLNRFLEDQFETLIANAVIGSGSELWHLRHGLSESARSLGKTIAFDVSVPRSRIMAFRREASEILRREFPQLLLIDFGHIADGGLHFNVVWPRTAQVPYAPEVVRSLRDRLYDLVVRQYDGSFSAEHGVGPHNIDYYRRYTDPTTQAIAGRLRTLTDPLKLCGAVDFGPLSPR